MSQRYRRCASRKWICAARKDCIGDRPRSPICMRVRPSVCLSVCLFVSVSLPDTGLSIIYVREEIHWDNGCIISIAISDAKFTISVDAQSSLSGRQGHFIVTFRWLPRFACFPSPGYDYFDRRIRLSAPNTCCSSSLNDRIYVALEQCSCIQFRKQLGEKRFQTRHKSVYTNLWRLINVVRYMLLIDFLRFSPNSSLLLLVQSWSDRMQNASAVGRASFNVFITRYCRMDRVYIWASDFLFMEIIKFGYIAPLRGRVLKMRYRNARMEACIASAELCWAFAKGWRFSMLLLLSHLVL